MTQALRAIARAVATLYGRDPAEIAKARKHIAEVRDSVEEDAREADAILDAAEADALSANLFPPASTH